MPSGIGTPTRHFIKSSFYHSENYILHMGMECVIIKEVKREREKYNVGFLIHKDNFK